MDRQLSEWKLGVERICSAAAPDYHEAARLAADMARASGEAMLRQAGAQALPVLPAPPPHTAGPGPQEPPRRPPRVFREVPPTPGTPRVCHPGAHPIPPPAPGAVPPQ